MTEVLKFGCATHNGNIRDHNEDNFIARPELGLWIVADGMGGHKNGEIASAIVTDTITELVGEGKELPIAIQYAHKAIIKAGEEGKGNPGMGSTVVAIQVSERNYEIAWVGDSRAYLWDGKKLHQMTKDHSYVQMLLDDGAITGEEALTHPKKNIIYQCMGSLKHNTLEVSTVLGEFFSGHKIILCSDGLNDEVSEENIARIVSADIPEQEIVDQLINATLASKGNDNVTVLLVSAPDSAPEEYSNGMKPFETQIYEVDVEGFSKNKLLVIGGIVMTVGSIMALAFFQ